MPSLQRSQFHFLEPTLALILVQANLTRAHEGVIVFVFKIVKGITNPTACSQGSLSGPNKTDDIVLLCS